MKKNVDIKFKNNLIYTVFKSELKNHLITLEFKIINRYQIQCISVNFVNKNNTLLSSSDLRKINIHTLIKRGYKTIEAYKKIDLKEFNKVTNYKYNNNVDYKILLKNIRSRKIKDRNKLLAFYSYIYQKESNNYGENISERLSQLTNYSESYIKNLTKEAFSKNFISNNSKGISGGHLTNKSIKLLNSQQ